MGADLSSLGKAPSYQDNPLDTSLLFLAAFAEKVSIFSFQSVEISKCERHLITSDLRVSEPCLNPGSGILRAIVILSLSHLGVTRARMNLRSKVLHFLSFPFQSYRVEYYLPEMVGRKFDGLNNKRTGLKNILPSTKSFPESF